MTTQTLQKLISLDLTDGNSVRSLFQELIQLIDNQKDEITKLRTDYDQLENETDEPGKKNNENGTILFLYVSDIPWYSRWWWVPGT